ncbi:PREDICTED: uncharacterized protein LOC106820462, partial [Priapulus caudatus]|uniref:Uncharacterized protein LOC106820462 n=1 Tax=Priapulus caudatus TaxID=37621 RepID=A0ABM1F7P3_PRICU
VPLKEIKYDPPPGLTDPISYLSISKDDRFAVAGFYNYWDGNSTFIVFDLATAAQQYEPSMITFNAMPECTAIINATEAVTGTKKGELVVWDLTTARPKRQLRSVNTVNTLGRQ